jgi:hypothetical protein
MSYPASVFRPGCSASALTGEDPSNSATSTLAARAHLAAQPSPAPAPRLDDEDGEFELPPLDADEEGDEATSDADLGDVLPSVEENDPLAMDDEHAHDLDIGLEIEGGAEESDDIEGVEEHVDIGPLDEGITALDGEPPVRDEDDVVAHHEDEDADLEAPGLHLDDGGEEGTGEDAGNDVDEGALPELDASEQDMDDERLADLLLEEAARGHLPPWAAARWSVLEGAGATVPCRAVAVAGGRVLAAGDVLLTVDEGAHAARRTGLEVPVSAIAAADEVTLVATTRGGLLESRDAGATGTPVAGWRSAAGPIALAATPGRIWILREGALWSMRGPDGAPQPVRDGVRAIAASGTVLVALAAGPEGLSISRLRGDDEAFHAEPLDAATAQVLEEDGCAEMAAAASGKAIALRTGRGLLLSRDGGRSFETVPLHGLRALCFAGDDEDAPALALVTGENEGASWLVRVTDEGEPARVAEIRGGGEGDTLAEATIVWDASRELSWVACRAGLVALGPARRH